MARKLRLEFPGACYHVINRGNYRADIFRTEGPKPPSRRACLSAKTRSERAIEGYGAVRLSG